jgi:N utilization substance protein B
MEENYISWIDDKSVVVGTMKKVLKSDTSSDSLFDRHKPDMQIVEDFGKELLGMTFEEDDELLDIIKPILENWDHERLAIIDMILIKMAIIEFLNFETIPVKVTLNEYVEISKMYSTPKSKEFVNGILDKILKKLQSEDKVSKQGRGLLD